MKKRLLLASICLVFMVLIFEGMTRLVYSIPALSEMIWVGDDLGWQRAWIERYQSSRRENSYHFDRYEPTLGWISKSNLRDVQVFGDKVLNTNSRGFRGTRNYTHRKDPNRVRIVVLGDSFTFGEEVSDNETYAHYLQELLVNAEVINMGMHGYGHDQMLLLLENEGIRYKPDIILLGFLTLDMSRNLRSFRDFAKPKFVLKNEELSLTGIPVPAPEDLVESDWARPRIADFLSSLRYWFKKHTGIMTIEEENITQAILIRLISIAKSIGAKPVITYLPVQPEFNATMPQSRGEKFLTGLCEKNRATLCFSTRPAFSENVDAGLAFKMDGHWGPSAHRVAATAISNRLAAEGLVVPLEEAM